MTKTIWVMSQNCEGIWFMESLQAEEKKEIYVGVGDWVWKGRRFPKADKWTGKPIPYDFENVKATLLQTMEKHLGKWVRAYENLKSMTEAGDA
jgi:hypothetical protein